jgi:hypothetical protein
MLKSVYDTNADNIVDHAALADTAPWTGITGKPASFAPSAHASTHNLGGSDAIAPDWTQVQNKPTTFAPSAHAASHVTGGSDIIIPASAATAGLLKQLSGNTTDFVDGTNTCQNLVTAVQPTIWSVRLRNFNAIGNSTFEIDQRTAGVGVNANGFIQDRWSMFKAGTMAVSAKQVAVVGFIPVPNTNFAITGYVSRVTLTTAQATLGATDQITFFQNIEGPRWRELMGDVHSISILARSTVANLQFGVSIRDSGTTRSYVGLCTLGAPNTWVLCQIPNIPIFASGGGWVITPGAVGYSLLISLAGGSTITTPANGVWQTGNYTNAVGQSNFAASPVNSTFDIAFVQHEPGPLCTTPIDCPFQQNYDDCLRYFQKTYQYVTAPGTVTTQGMKSFIAPTAPSAFGPVTYLKPMAKIPTVTLYNHATGAANSVQDGNAVNHASASAAGVGDAGFAYITYTTATTATVQVYAQYTLDTGW